MCEYIPRHAQGLVNMLSDLKERMTNLLSSWLGLRSKWKVKRRSRSSDVSGFLKRKWWLLQGRRCKSCFCGLCTEMWGRRGRMKPQHIKFPQVHVQISMTSVYICSQRQIIGCFSPEHCPADTGAAQWVTWWNLPWNRERWACWSMSLPNAFTKTNVRAAITQRRPFLFGNTSNHMVDLKLSIQRSAQQLCI